MTLKIELKVPKTQNKILDFFYKILIFMQKNLIFLEKKVAKVGKTTTCSFGDLFLTFFGHIPDDRLLLKPGKKKEIRRPKKPEKTPKVALFANFWQSPKNISGSRRPPEIFFRRDLSPNGTPKNVNLERGKVGFVL